MLRCVWYEHSSFVPRVYRWGLDSIEILCFPLLSLLSQAAQSGGCLQLPKEPHNEFLTLWGQVAEISPEEAVSHFGGTSPGFSRSGGHRDQRIETESKGLGAWPWVSDEPAPGKPVSPRCSQPTQGAWRVSA